MYPCMYLHVRAHDLICSGYIVHNVPSFEARHAPDKIVYATLGYEYLRYVKWILVVSHLRTFELRTAPPLTPKCPTFHSSRYPMNCSVPLPEPNSTRSCGRVCANRVEEMCALTTRDWKRWRDALQSTRRAAGELGRAVSIRLDYVPISGS